MATVSFWVKFTKLMEQIKYTLLQHTGEKLIIYSWKKSRNAYSTTLVKVASSKYLFFKLDPLLPNAVNG